MEVVLRIKAIVLLISIFLISACSSEQKQPFNLDYFYNANPAEDAKKAISRDDFHVYAIYGGNPYTPEIKRGCLKDHNIIPIKGTSDAIENYEHDQFNALAKVYAEHYNFQIKHYLIKQGNSCLAW